MGGYKIGRGDIELWGCPKGIVNRTDRGKNWKNEEKEI